MTTWQPYRESIRATILRNGIIALVGGALVTRFSGGVPRWPAATLLMLWPSFGGHFVEVWFLNWLRPRIPDGRIVQVAARIAIWFLAGAIFAAAMAYTAALTGFRPLRISWWIAGLAFIAIELIAQLPLQFSGRPSFYNGRG